MWKKLVVLLSGINLLLSVPTSADQTQLVKYPVDGRVVEIKGQLYNVKGDANTNPPIPFDYWELLADGKTYYLVLRGDDLLATAGQLNTQTVVVTGVLAATSPTIRVTSIKADEYVNVEIRGRLCQITRELPLWGDPQPYLNKDVPELSILGRRLLDEWTITADGKTYYLDFDDAAMLKQAEKLNTSAVIVTGTPKGFAIHVTSLQADESKCPKQAVSTEVKGMMKQSFGPSPWSKADLHWELTIKGQVYELDFGAFKDLADMASDLDGKAVVLTGVLEIIPARVVGGLQLLPKEEKASVRDITEPYRIAGKLIIHVTSLKLANARKPAEYQKVLEHC
jgi:hypothetical protein